MTVSSLQPLTVEEQGMAEKYIDRVDKFLRRKRLDPDEYYDVVIFGYLAAIQRECRNPAPPEKKNFFALLDICMERAVYMEWNRQNADMRRGDRMALSLDSVPAHTDDGVFSLYDVVPSPCADVASEVINRDLIDRALEVGTSRQLEMIQYAMDGYEAHEIAEIFGLSRQTVSRTLCNFRNRARAVRDDREVIKHPCPAYLEAHRERIAARNKVYEKAYRERHREEINAKKRAYRAIHLEEMQAKERERYRARREEICAKDRAYRAAHPEEVRAKERAKRKAWREAHPEEARARERAKYAVRKQRKAALDAANINGGVVAVAV
ncbi:ECF-type sigma factor [uncultured Dysosmobacter sp.]|uniref:ECF-type sigma factor n=1 Tax=uncultured Dysosmobacter sp. TaxID=2591384 RepID=UPI002603B9AB|nr:ECF-type sigma factor [uncultured Dysosmobacter sp.]